MPADQAKIRSSFFGKGGGFFSPARRPTIQRDLAKTIPTSDGAFGMDMHSIEGAKAVPPTTAAGENVDLTFEPSPASPYSNEIRLIQIIRDRDTAGKDIDIASMPPGRGTALRTTEGLGTDVRPGFETDVLHQDFDAAGNPTTVEPQGSQKGLAYEGGIPIPGFKRSNDSRDIKAAEITDTPQTTADRDYAFETVAKGVDTGVVYGSLRWSFSARNGRVTNERADAADTQSATFDAAVEKHRNFYVHEPVVFYFDYKKDEVSVTEDAKIDEFLDYLHRFPDVRLSLEGYADHRGGMDPNLTLARKRVDNVVKALIAKKVDGSRIDKAPAIWGATEDFTKGDVTPNPGRSQDLEANRRGNRRVVLTFSHTVSLPGP
jgi:outer membrane protein OmpA-like peptidoglycan-associated protein